MVRLYSSYIPGFMDTQVILSMWGTAAQVICMVETCRRKMECGHRHVVTPWTAFRSRSNGQSQMHNSKNGNWDSFIHSQSLDWIFWTLYVLKTMQGSGGYRDERCKFLPQKEGIQNRVGAGGRNISREEGRVQWLVWRTHKQQDKEGSPAQMLAWALLGLVQTEVPFLYVVPSMRFRFYIRWYLPHMAQLTLVWMAA